MPCSHLMPTAWQAEHGADAWAPRGDQGLDCRSSTLARVLSLQLEVLTRLQNMGRQPSEELLEGLLGAQSPITPLRCLPAQCWYVASTAALYQRVSGHQVHAGSAAMSNGMGQAEC